MMETNFLFIMYLLKVDVLTSPEYRTLGRIVHFIMLLPSDGFLLLSTSQNSQYFSVLLPVSQQDIRQDRENDDDTDDDSLDTDLCVDHIQAILKHLPHSCSRKCSQQQS